MSGTSSTRQSRWTTGAILTSLAFKAGPEDRAELMLFIALAMHSDKQGFCYPNVERLAEYTRQHERNVRRVMEKLQADGWVIVGKRGRNHDYTINLTKLAAASVECRVPLSEQEEEFIAPFIADKMSGDSSENADNLSGVADADPDPIPDISDTDTGHFEHEHRTFSTEIPDIFVPYIENLQEPSLTNRKEKTLVQVFDFAPAVDRLFEFYCETFRRDPKRYTLSQKRREKATLRLREREKLGGPEEAIREAEQCIRNLAASEYHVTGGYIDWIEQIFRSQEEFEKRLAWRPRTGGENGRGNHRAQTAHKADQRTGGNLDAAARLLASRRNREGPLAAGGGEAGSSVGTDPRRLLHATGA